jgi:hypothetical protein
MRDPRPCPKKVIFGLDERSIEQLAELVDIGKPELLEKPV